MPVPKGLPEVLFPELQPGPEMVLPPGIFEANCTGDSQQEESHAAALEEAKKQMGTPKRFKYKHRLVADQVRYDERTMVTPAMNPSGKQRGILRKSVIRLVPNQEPTKKTERPAKQRAKRPTKKEQDEQAANKILATPASEGYLHAKISAEVHKLRQSAKLDRVYKKTKKVMKQWAELGDGDGEELAEEQECLVTFIGKMVELQHKRKRQLSAASTMAETSAAYTNIKHAPLQRIV